MKKASTKEIGAGDATKIAEARKKLRQFRFQGAGSRAKNVHEGRNLRREIARLLTAKNVK